MDLFCATWPTSHDKVVGLSEFRMDFFSEGVIFRLIGYPPRFSAIFAEEDNLSVFQLISLHGQKALQKGIYS